MHPHHLLRPLLSLFAMASACAVTATLAADAPGPNSRAQALKIVENLRRIVTPQGVERLEAVRIGGIDQWISVRGVPRTAD